MRTEAEILADMEPLQERLRKLSAHRADVGDDLLDSQRLGGESDDEWEY
jgi:hypothetical protein